MGDFLLSKVDNMFIPFLHYGSKSVLLQAGMRDLKADITFRVILEKGENDEGIPNMIGRQLHAELPPTLQDVICLTLR